VLLLAPAAILLALSPTADAASTGAVLHEQIPPDPREDVALSVSLDGDLPAALATPSGIVTAPDPRQPVPPGARLGVDSSTDAVFRPDRDTRRPDVLPYDDPFRPSTAPFKRLMAFDTVLPSYALGVRDARMQPLAIRGRGDDPAEEHFFGDMVVDLSPGKRTRIPTVGPSARVLRARTAVGLAEVQVRLFRDGADNWFVEGDATTRARLIMELSVARATFGGEFGNPRWVDLGPSNPLPPNIRPAAAEVTARIGVSTAMQPREVVSKLVAYFRSFSDSDLPPSGGRDIYLDLALSKKGVCRHRAFAFMVTALSLDIPTRMVLNEAHAWVEVFDGSLWRRIDLGGAGRSLGGQVTNTPSHDPPPDPFAWPPGATRGQDMADRARQSATPSPGPGSKSGTPSPDGSGAGATSAAPSPATGASSSAVPAPSAEKDARAPSVVSLALLDVEARRGAALRVTGEVASEGEACPHALVEIILRDPDRPSRQRTLGALAADEKGEYTGSLVVPPDVELGDYDVLARTPGDARCGRGSAQ
jgi:hypothetical protein